MNLNQIINPDFNGVLSVKKAGELVFQNAYGYADIANKIPNETDTKFATASAGKVFTAAGILKLIENGKLKLTETIGDLLAFDLKKIDKYITIRQLLNHTSGIPDYFDETVMKEYADLWTDFPNYKIRSSMDLLPLFINKPMMYKPGEKFHYNNTGFVVLGLIIEKLTNELFDEYLKNNIFKPCGMKNTGYYELDRLPEKCANSYIYDAKRKEYYTNIYSVDVKGTGAGGAFTTVLDVEKFWETLLKGGLFSNDLVKEMVSLQSYSNNDYYGYGIWLKKTGEQTFDPWFQGRDPGVSFISSYDRKNDVTVTIISNIGNNVWEMERNIIAKMEVL